MFPPSAGAAKPKYGIAPRGLPTSSFGNPGTFTAAANQQGSDYDSIMKQYQDYINKFSGANPSGGGTLSTSPITGGRPLNAGNPINPGNPITSSPISSGNPLRYEDVKSNPINAPRPIGYDPLTAKTTDYNQSDDVTGSLGRLKDLVDTGGYTQQGIQDIRERSVSPIRSIYASGKQNLERQRSLSGGYSPNFNAVSASMARDQADKIGGLTTRVNADIAQNVASNKLAAAPQYAAASARANEAKTAADQRNTDIINQINEANAGRKTSIDEFNTTTGLGVDKYNRDTQLGVDVGNRDFRANTDRYNRDTQLSTDRYNRDTQLGLDERNRNVRLDTDRYNRDTQLSTDKNNRDFQFGVDSSNRDAKMNADKFNIDDIVRRTGMDRNDILEAIRGQASLYGTTPALTNTFGNQVVQANQMGQNQQDINNRRRSVIIGAGR